MKLRTKLVVLFVTFCALCCGPYWSNSGLNGTLNTPQTQYICIDLPSDQLPAAHEAVATWDKSLKQWIRLVPLDGPNNDHCRVLVHSTTSINSDSPTALAWTDAVGGNEVWMKVGRYEQDVKGILMHELGHAFGAQHVAGTLMNANWSPTGYSCPDRTTIVQVAAWNHVNLELLTWCFY